MADSCHVLQSFKVIFMILGHMGEKHTEGIPVQLIILFDVTCTILYLNG